MSLALQMSRCCVALAGVVAFASGTVAAQNEPIPTAAQPFAHTRNQPTRATTTVTLPNGLTLGCVVPVPPEPATAQVANKRYIPPLDPIPPCLTPEQREAHERANAALQRLHDLQNPTHPQQVQSLEVQKETYGEPQQADNMIGQRAIPVPTAFAVPRMPNSNPAAPSPPSELRLTSGSATTLPPSVQAAYDAANQLNQFNSANPNVTYDANGNLTSIIDVIGTTTFTYDARNRLIARNGPGINESYTYDALGRRVTKTTNGTTKSYLYDGNDIVAEVQGGAVTASYLRGQNIDETFVRQTANGNEYYHADALGSTLSLTDNSGIIRTQYDYDAYGNTMVTGVLSSNPFQYTGRENDGEGLYHYRARYYSPEFHRFMNEDPMFSPLFPVQKCKGSYAPDPASYAEIDPALARLMAFRFYNTAGGAVGSNPQKMHRYSYADNNPINKFDPMGLIASSQDGQCTLMPDLTKCQTECCKAHDDCYKTVLSFCSMSSFIDVSARLTRPDCLSCNRSAVQCVVRNFLAGNVGRKDTCNLKDFGGG